MHGLIVSVRKSRGRDIRAACGQLIVEGQKQVSRAAARRHACEVTRTTTHWLRGRPGGMRSFR